MQRNGARITQWGRTGQLFEMIVDGTSREVRSVTSSTPYTVGAPGADWTAPGRSGHRPASARHSRRVEQRLSGLAALRQRVALLVAEEGVQADGEAERVQNLVFHRRDKRLQLLLFGRDATRTQVGVAGDRPRGEWQPRSATVTR